MKTTFKFLQFLAFGIFLFNFAACSDDDDGGGANNNNNNNNGNNCNFTFESQTASGMFFSEPFTFVEGIAENNAFDSTEFRYLLFGDTINGDACDIFVATSIENKIIFTTPKEEGTYPLTNNETVSFQKQNLNEVDGTIAICGEIVISSITSNTISGKIVADAQDGENLINGDFSVKRCP